MANLEISSQCSFLVFRPPRSKHHLKHCKKPQRKHDVRRGMRCRCEIASVQGSGGRRSAAAATQDSGLSRFLRTVLSQSIRRAMGAMRAHELLLATVTSARANVHQPSHCHAVSCRDEAVHCRLPSSAGMPGMRARACARRHSALRQAWIMHASHRKRSSQDFWPRHELISL